MKKELLEMILLKVSWLFNIKKNKMKKVTRKELIEMIQKNQDVSNVDTSGITDMRYMFYGATAFNQDISGWDTSNVKYMDFMFYGAKSFNKDIRGWNVSNVKDRYFMFEGATSFNQEYSPNKKISEVKNED